MAARHDYDDDFCLMRIILFSSNYLFAHSLIILSFPMYH